MSEETGGKGKEVELNRIIHGDCLEIMPQLPDRSVDMILSDWPYGTTACEWDSIIPLEPLWKECKRVIKPNGAIVLMADEPFSSVLVVNDLEWFKYKWIWKKSVAANFMNAKLKPLKIHEEVLVFSLGKTSNGNNNNMVYNPQGLKRVNQRWSRPAKYPSEHNYVRPNHQLERTIEYTGYPESVIEFGNGNNNSVHPTQKPVALFAYLIRTYSNPGDLILDNAAGSCTTAIAAIETGRNWLCIEKELKYVEIGRERVEKRMSQPFLPGITEKVLQPTQSLLDF